ncbi:putative spermidine/putrescine transport system permease protein/spermidine/putrescine transport system permease protein [Rhodoligotrophos appendicifer]|uniref:ABC transporter permease n=1 Tax=Rhodoligotrophos appendicifer TaxID=987056 RepID=UPI001185E50A|nr:ABC transporter permease [Rhodoligotrophos appendicifer]
MTATALHFRDDVNAQGLAADQRAERRGLFALCSPGLLLVLLLLLIPVGWLFTLSAIDGDGALTTENYTRIWTEGAYVNIFIVTFKISALVTLICVAIGYPLAYCLSQIPQKWAGILMLGVLVPFWTSLLVRTYAWLVLLQRRGIVNSFLMDIGAITAPLPLVNNMTGVIIGMVHVMLPFLVLPLYASMRSIDTGYLRAAANLGASPTRAFWQIFFPLSMPGLVAGLILTFVLCLGFYITPAVLGGGKVQMIAQRVEASVSLYPTWGPAAALGVVLLVLTSVFLLLSRWALSRLNAKLG